MRILPVLLLLLLIALLAVGMSPTAAQTVTPGVTPGVPTATPGLPVLVVTPATGCAAPLQLTIGGQVLLRGGVNVRSQPNLSGALVNYYDHQVRLRLIDGPVCTNGYNWWRVAGIGEPGWVVEGTPGRYFMEPFIDPNAVNCFPPLDTVTVGGRILTITGSRIRLTPGIRSFVLTAVLNGAILEVIGGPNCLDGLNWWRVRAPFGNTPVLVSGWIAEGYPGEYYIEGLPPRIPQIPCHTALRLSAGSRGAVTYDDGVPRRLRSAPNVRAPIIANLLDGIAFDVIEDGAVCANGYNWWHVRILTTGLTGWLAEGIPGDYWFEVMFR
jgi:hypothetical protein